MAKKDLRKELSFDKLTRMNPKNIEIVQNPKVNNEAKNEIDNQETIKKVILISEELHTELKSFSAQKKTPLRKVIEKCLWDFLKAKKQ